jgi:hypothetical protein
MNNERELMTKDDRENVRYRIEEEGLHYTFEGYSRFPDIKDERFHELRKAYLLAAENLVEYVG